MIVKDVKTLTTDDMDVAVEGTDTRTNDVDNEYDVDHEQYSTYESHPLGGNFTRFPWVFRMNSKRFPKNLKLDTEG